jgi:hypothetical protein
MCAHRLARRRPRVHIVASVLVVGALLAAVVSAPAIGQEEAAADPQPWQRAEAPFTPTDLELWDVIAGGPGFIAVGGGFEAGHEVGTAAIWVSQDGRTWQSVALLGEAATGIPRSITATPEGFVAVGSGCCPDRAAVWLSRDGLAWERLPDQPAFADAAMFGVIWQDDGLVAVGCSAVLECFSGLAWTSPDGRTWSEPVVLDMLPGDVAATTRGTFAVGSSEGYEGSAALALNVDGATWSESSVIAPSGSLHAAIDTPAGILVVGGTTSPRRGRAATLAFISLDGVTWQPLEGPGLEGVWLEDAAAAADGWLLAGWSSGRSGELPAALWTADLETFSAIPFPREMKEGGLVHAAAVGSDGTTMVVVGSTILNRGEVPTVWVRETSEAEAAG